MAGTTSLANYIDGTWRHPAEATLLDVTNPATGQVIAKVPLSPAAEVHRAAQTAAAAWHEWRRTPVTERIQPLFKFRELLLANRPELARLITSESGKTLAESQGELQRGIENVEVACGAPTLLQGYNNEDIAGGIDEHMIRQPLGTVAAITPFNFPSMIPLWFLPYAVVCGNCFILKPSERVPLTSARLFELLEETGLPKGVVQLVHGGRETVDAILAHPQIQAVSFVGSTPVAKYVYAQAAANGKRAQCQGGAKNPVVIMPDADMEMTTKIVTDSAFGCAGQRCLAASLAVAVGDSRKPFTEAMADSLASRRVGSGLDDGVEMGPVISGESKDRISQEIDKALQAGAHSVVDGRGKAVAGYKDGYFLFPTLLDQVDPASEIARTEIFGPVLSVTHASDIDQAIEMLNRSRYGNMACIFTASGAAARKFRYEVTSGNIGVNVGVAAPMAFYPFSGWKESFFGDLHGQGRHAIEFYTQTKVVVERWPREWTRKF